MNNNNERSSYFLWRRLHSIAGIWLVIFVIFHLLTNSQAALPIGNDGNGFIRAVNSIHDLPYLLFIEIAVLALPIVIHLIWGVKYLRTASYNSFGSTGRTPYLPEYPRNHAYTWQRITSWLLIFGVIAHVVHMRFIEYPWHSGEGTEAAYMVRVSTDKGLNSLAKRLGVRLYDEKHIGEIKSGSGLAAALEKHPLQPDEVVAVASTFGAAELLMVRDTFKLPYMIVLYTLLVLATSFHAFNGLWTASISWGATLTERSQRRMRTLSTLLLIVVTFLGLAAIWLTYWVNLKS